MENLRQPKGPSVVAKVAGEAGASFILKDTSLANSPASFSSGRYTFVFQNIPFELFNLPNPIPPIHDFFVPKIARTPRSKFCSHKTNSPT